MESSKKEQFLKEYEDCHNFVLAALRIGYSRSRIWQVMEDDEGFRKAYDEIKEDYRVMQLHDYEELLKERAKDSKAQMSTIALLAYLKTLDDKYRDKQGLEIKGNIILKLGIPRPEYPEIEGGDKALEEGQA